MKKNEVGSVFNVLLSTKLFRIMKMTLLLLTIACLQVSANSYSQDKITLRMKTADIKRVLFAIEKNSGYRFLFDEDVIKGKPKVSVAVENAPIDEVLSEIFSNTGIRYKILNTNLVVLKESAAMTDIIVREVRVSGKVTSAAGIPLPGVSVSIKGSSVGTTTDAEGNYLLTVPDDATLEFSYIGYVNKEEKVNGRNLINVVMQSAEQTLDAIVVIGYGTQKKRDLTGSVSSVNGTELARMPNNNPLSSLQGKVAGLTVVNSGRAGASPTVRIRGVNSTNGSSSPLYVVDGVFQTNIDYLNPGDIESIEVLRDPSSIAIFGLQGGNGVIIVTTKRASRGQTTISFQTNTGIQKAKPIDVVDAEGFKMLYSAQLANTPGASPFDFSNYTANTSWQDLIFRNALLNNNTLSITSSGEKSTSLFSLGYNAQEGVLKNDKYQRYIARLNHEIRFNENIKIGGDITGFHWISENPNEAVLNSAIRAVPVVPVKAGDWLYYSMPSFQRAQVGNPVAAMEQAAGNAINKGFRFVGNIFAEVKFLRSFTFRSSFYTDLGFNQGRSYTPPPFRYINLGENGGPTDTASSNPQGRTGVSQSQAEFRKYQQDHTLTFTKRFGTKHNLTALVGFSTLYQGNSSVSGSRTDTSLVIPRDPDFWYLGIVDGNSNPVFNSGGGGEEAFMSMLSRVNYSYGGKYLLNASFRRDGSSKFAKANRWGNFGSIGMGWVISEEDFFAVRGIDFLKLRGAWGTVGGGLGLGSNLFRPGLRTDNVGVFGDNVYGSVVPDYVPDSNLHWSSVRGIDVGLDIRALNNRLSAELTFYDRTTKDLLTTVQMLGTAGPYPYLTNLGTLSNKGVELTLGWNDRIGNDFTYNITGNVSYNHNRVVSIGDNLNFEILRNGNVNRTISGQSVGYFWGYRQIGIYQSVADMDKMPTMPTSLPGDVAFEDVNGDGKIDPADRTYLGTPFPLYNFGGNITLGYKNFDLVVDGQGVAGNKIYTQRRTATFATLNYESNRLNAWTGAGTTNVEPILDNNRGNNFLFSTYFLEPGDYFRLRTVQLGYTFPRHILNRTPVKQLRVYISGQNIATFTKATGFTPEVSLGDPLQSGADNGTYPVPSIYSFGLNISF